MRHAKIFRQACPVRVLGVLVRQRIKLLPRRTPVRRFAGRKLARVLAPEFGGQVESLGGRHLRHDFLGASCAQSVLNLFVPLRKRPRPEDVDYVSRNFSFWPAATNSSSPVRW